VRRHKLNPPAHNTGRARCLHLPPALRKRREEKRREEKRREEKRREEKRREEKRREEKRREGFLGAGFIFGSVFGFN
ncbi:hypothetical protein, partial [Neisseria meningitidis]|uniref:hypothetical protein n=1 Tax=Neisseria meningitidis TaxID=487 RepID=UPI003879F4F3